MPEIAWKYREVFILKIIQSLPDPRAAQYTKT